MKKRNAVRFKIIYLLLAVPMFYYVTQDIQIGGFGFMYRYLFGLAIMALAFLQFLIEGEPGRFGHILKTAAVLSVPYLFTLLYSMIVWITGLAPLKVMTRGLFFIVYQEIAILAAASVLYLAGKSGVLLQLSAVLMANGIHLAESIQKHGLSGFLGEYKELILSMTARTGPIMKHFEVLGYSYIFGLFLVYLILAGREFSEGGSGGWRRAGLFLLGLLCTAFFFLGLKRSVLLGAGIALAAGFLLERLPGSWLRRVCLGLCWLGVAGGIAYIIACRYGWFHWLESMGINTNSRVEVMDLFRSYYDLGLGFFGRGAGYVSGMIASGELVIEVDGYQFGDIHNDFLRQYIELGAFGFAAWLWTFLNFRVGWLFRAGEDREGVRRGALGFCFILAVFITFLTENSLYHYYTTLTMALLVMAGFAGEGRQEGTDGDKAA